MTPEQIIGAAIDRLALDDRHNPVALANGIEALGYAILPINPSATILEAMGRHAKPGDAWRAALRAFEHDQQAGEIRAALEEAGGKNLGFGMYGFRTSPGGGR